MRTSRLESSLTLADISPCVFALLEQRIRRVDPSLPPDLRHLLLDENTINTQHPTQKIGYAPSFWTNQTTSPSSSHPRRIGARRVLLLPQVPLLNLRTPSLPSNPLPSRFFTSPRVSTILQQSPNSTSATTTSTAPVFPQRRRVRLPDAVLLELGHDKRRELPMELVRLG